MTTTTTRRAMLAGTAALPALALATTAPTLADIWAPAPDPIFAALDAFRRADAGFSAQRKGIPGEACEQWWNAKCAVMRTRPTTPAGLAALTGFARDMSARQGAGNLWKMGELCDLTATLDDATRGMAGLVPWSPPASTVTGNDPIYAAIEAHRAAVAHHDAVQAEEFRLEEILPLNRRRWAMNSEESLDVAAKRDDHRWLENCVESHHAFERMDALAMDLIQVRPATPAGVAALLAYVAAELGTGRINLPPNMPDDDDEGEGEGHGPLREHRWLVLLLRSTAAALADRVDLPPVSA